MKRSYKKPQLIITLAILALLNPGFANAEPKITTIYKNYKVSGTNIDEIKSAIQYSGPKSKDGRKFAAKTDYDVFWNYKYDQTGPGCKIASVNTEVVLTYKMPELDSTSILQKEHENQWRQYYASLKLHEDGHAQRGIDAAIEIEKAIQNMLPHQNCKSLATEANKLGRKIIKKYNDDNISYDEYTKHGHTQGAFLASRTQNVASF